MEVNRRSRLYAKIVFPEIDTRKTKFVVWNGNEYRLLGAPRLEFLGSRVPSWPMYDIETLRLERYVYTGKRRCMEITLAYSKREDVCVISPSATMLYNQEWIDELVDIWGRQTGRWL